MIKTIILTALVANIGSENSCKFVYDLTSNQGFSKQPPPPLNTTNIPSDLYNKCNTIAFPHGTFHIKESAIKLIWNNGRPDATGTINQYVYPQTGHVTFPDDRLFLLWFYPDLGVIYWDQDKGSKRWRGGVVTCRSEWCYILVDTGLRGW